MKRVIRTLLTATVWIAQLIWLSSCTRGVELPEPVQQEYNKEKIFQIARIENCAPASGNSIRRILYVSGTVTYYSYDSLGGFKGAWPGQLPEDQWRKVQEILKAMTTIPSHDPFSGREVITLSFLWHGENYIASFSEKNCPDELERLFDITNTAWTVENPFPNPCRERPLSNSSTADTLCSPLNVLPNTIGFASDYSARLFQINWFEQPFTGSYEQLYFAVDGRKFDNFVTYGRSDSGGSVPYGGSTEAERQEVQAILVSLADIDSTERPVGNILITLGFSWEGDYRILVFGDANCPAGLRRLFEIADMPFKRDVPDYDLFQIPCAPISTVTSTLQTP